MNTQRQVPERLRIVVLLSSLGIARGGLETTVMRLSTGLAARGHEVALVTGLGGAPPSRSLAPMNLLRVPCVPATLRAWRTLAARRPGWPLTAQSLSFVAGCRLHPGVRRVVTRADVTITALEAETVGISRWSAGRGPPNVSLFLGVIDPGRLRRDRSAVRLAVSADLAERMTRRHGISIDGVLLSGAPEAWLRVPYQVRPELRVLLFIGRLEANKGVRELIALFERLAPEIPQVRLRLLGDGPQRGAVLADVTRAGLDARVHLAGAVDGERVRRELRDADLLVFPSRHETFSQAVLEALAVGVPVVASDVAGNREAAAGAACLLPLDDTEAWVGAVRALAGDPARRLRMSTTGRAVAAQVTPERATVRLERYLALAMERARAPAHPSGDAGRSGSRSPLPR